MSDIPEGESTTAGVDRRYAHRLADVAKERPGLAELYRLVETLARGAHEPLRVVIDAADGVRLVQVCVEPCSKKPVSL